MQISKDQTLDILDALDAADEALAKHASVDHSDASGRAEGNDAYHAREAVQKEYGRLSKQLEAIQKREDEQMDNGNTEWSLSR